MNFLETCKLAITTLSPIHIGCGEDFEPTNYVIDGKRLYTFDPVLLLRELGPQDHEKFASIVEKPDSLRLIQKFLYDRKSTAGKIGRLSADVVEAAQAFYDSRIGQVAQREQGGKNVLNRLEIARTAFNPVSGQPILPGSSLKGAIRTAMLDSLMGDRRYPVNTKDRDGKPLREGAVKKEAGRQNQRMIQEVLELSENAKLRFATDPFRFLKIGDAAFRPKHKTKGKDGAIKETERRPRILFQVNLKKRPNKYDASGNINTLVECIPGSTPRVFMAQWTVERKAGHGGNTPGLQLDFATVANACNRFYLERFHAEASILKTNKYAEEWVGGVEKWLEPDGFLKKMMDDGQGFLLRVGRHSGAESVTVNAPRSIKIMKGKGQQSEYAEAATTLWLAADNKEQMGKLQPFGWVFVQRFA